jgi:hypothetical protein
MKGQVSPLTNRDRPKMKLKEIGWREWIGFPDWGVAHIKVKVDTGARTSSLHADDIQLYQLGDVTMVRFVVHPWQASSEDLVPVEMPVHSMREVRSSSGQAERRPVVVTTMKVAGRILKAELTLTNRDLMGFRMLLGREALRGRFTINPGVSYRGGRPSKDIRSKNRGRSL